PTNGGGGSTNPPPGPSPSPSVAPSPTPSESPSPSPSASASASASATPSPSPSASPSGARIWQLRPGVRLTLNDEGIYQIFFRRAGRLSILKFTIDRTPPVLSLQAASRA